MFHNPSTYFKSLKQQHSLQYEHTLVVSLYNWLAGSNN